ncbi:MAG: LuxR family transcriptional regulator [Rhodobacteraceae bacterium]|nr:LuxR family transcriptional regulator [Paracoccaceae bacterium]
MRLFDLGTLPATPTPVTGFLDQLCERFEFDYAAYAGINAVDGTVHGFVNYPDDWKHHYAAQGFHAIDPTLRKASRSVAPVDWQRLEHDRDFAAVFRSARDFGITDRGLTIPVRGPYGDMGMLSVTRDCKPEEWRKLKRAVMTDLQGVATHIHDTVMRSGLVMRSLRVAALSTREREILQWIAAGKTHMDVSDILSISHRTVEVHVRSARTKLHALTTPQAVARAIALGLIQPL